VNAIQSGERTHHQDQSMCPVSFSPTNRSVSNVPSPGVIVMDGFVSFIFVFVLPLMSVRILFAF
jgi:hypothetical protein